MNKITVFAAAIVCAAWLASGPVRAAAEHQDDAPITVKGEVVDLACYLGHGAMGEKHAKCAKTCIESGLPVGIKAENGTTYIVIGDHKPLNEKLASHAGEVVTLRGKATEKDGIHLLSSAELVN